MTMLYPLRSVLLVYAAAARELEQADQQRENAEAGFRSACIALLATIGLAVEEGASVAQVAAALDRDDDAALRRFCSELERVSGESLSPDVTAALARGRPWKGSDRIAD